MLNILSTGQNAMLEANLADYAAADKDSAGAMVDLIESDLHWYLGHPASVDWPEGWRPLAIAIRNVWQWREAGKRGKSPLARARSTIRRRFEFRYRL